MNNITKFIKSNKLRLFVPGIFIILVLGLSGVAYAVNADQCGGTQDGNHPVNTSIDLGCSHYGNPISDLFFAIIRLLADGVGIVVVASVIVAGIQFSVSQGDPQATSNAIGRIRTSVMALIIFLFGFGILNWLIPGGFLH